MPSQSRKVASLALIFAAVSQHTCLWACTSMSAGVACRSSDCLLACSSVSWPTAYSIVAHRQCPKGGSNWCPPQSVSDPNFIWLPGDVPSHGAITILGMDDWIWENLGELCLVWFTSTGLYRFGSMRKLLRKHSMCYTKLLLIWGIELNQRYSAMAVWNTIRYIVSFSSNLFSHQRIFNLGPLVMISSPWVLMASWFA